MKGIKAFLFEIKFRGSSFNFCTTTLRTSGAEKRGEAKVLKVYRFRNFKELRVKEKRESKISQSHQSL